MTEQPASIWDLKMFPWDRVTPRFYPPGQHPAFAQMREQHHRLQRFVDLHGETTETRKALDYFNEQIAAFEGSESEEKVRADAQLRARRTDKEED